MKREIKFRDMITPTFKTNPSSNYQINATFSETHLVMTFEDCDSRVHQIIPIEYAKQLIAFLNENQPK